jgi:hypothetical protein
MSRFTPGIMLVHAAVNMGCGDVQPQRRAIIET